MNSNRLKKIPDEVGQLEQLEELILSENSIEALPDNLSRMSSLRILKLSNNKLTNLPYEIAELPTIEIIDCGNNPKMSDLPLKWQGDTDSILFTCKLHRGALILLCMYVCMYVYLRIILYAAHHNHGKLVLGLLWLSFCMHACMYMMCMYVCICVYVCMHATLRLQGAVKRSQKLE